MDESSLLHILLGEFYDKLKRLKDLVPRDLDFPEAENKIKVAIGMRRTGKTYCMYQRILKLVEDGIPLQAILYINCEDDRLLPLEGERVGKLVDAFYSLYPENHDRKCYFFFDEIQSALNWPLVIRRLHDTKNAEMFLTGSSAKLLSKEIATTLRGRSLAIEVWPYSFHEFLKAHHTSIDRSLYDKKTQDRLSQFLYHYLSSGGFPEITSFPSDLKQKTLQEYIDVTIFRDIVERHQIKNAQIVKYMILSMLHNVGKPFSINKLYNDLQSQGYKTGKEILYAYADYIEDAYLAFTVPLYDRSLRKVETNPKKLYAIDPGLVRAVTFDETGDLGRLFENVVYLDLKRLGCTVYYYLTKERYEVDFLVKTPRGQKKLFQVALKMDDEETIRREERALLAAKQELQMEGEIVTLDSWLLRGICF